MNPDSLTSEDLQKFHRFGISKNDKQAKFDLNKVRIMQAEISKTYNAYNTDYRINIGSKNPVQITRAENAKKEEWDKQRKDAAAAQKLPDLETLQQEKYNPMTWTSLYNDGIGRGRERVLGKRLLKQAYLAKKGDVPIDEKYIPTEHDKFNQHVPDWMLNCSPGPRDLWHSDYSMNFRDHSKNQWGKPLPALRRSMSEKAVFLQTKIDPTPFKEKTYMSKKPY